MVRFGKIDPPRRSRLVVYGARLESVCPKGLASSNLASSAMVPNAKKNLHECEYHLSGMKNSLSVEELEINFAAFVNSARNVTFVLQKEFAKNDNFKKWYGDKDNPKRGTKIYEMSGDNLCSFFCKIRSEIIKEGINRINCSTTISSFNSANDMIGRPMGSSLVITGKGIYYLVGKNTSKEDLVPAKTKANMITTVFLDSAPVNHLGLPIEDNNILSVSEIYFNYLKSLVEEWTGIVNS
jgi:hypothetical protein